MARTKKEPPVPTRCSERVQIIKAVEKSKKETTAKVTKPKRFRRPRQRKSCRLLALPGELRNRIYTYALVEAGPINVTPNAPGQPALLKVCRATRSEAERIYYGDNDFVLRIENFNGADFLPFARQFFVYHSSPGKVSFHFSGSPNWENLVAWIKAHELHFAMIPDVAKRSEGDDLDQDDYIMSGAFKVVDAMKWMRWEVKEKALQGLYQALRGTCSKWVKAEDRGFHP